MALFAVRRRSGWVDLMALEASARKSSEIIDKLMLGKMRWIRSYVIKEFDERLGTFCILEGSDLETIAQHAKTVGIRCDEISPIATTMILRPDPGAIYYRN